MAIRRSTSTRHYFAVCIRESSACSPITSAPSPSWDGLATNSRRSPKAGSNLAWATPKEPIRGLAGQSRRTRHRLETYRSRRAGNRGTSQGFVEETDQPSLKLGTCDLLIRSVGSIVDHPQFFLSLYLAEQRTSQRQRNVFVASPGDEEDLAMEGAKRAKRVGAKAGPAGGEDRGPLRQWPPAPKVLEHRTVEGADSALEYQCLHSLVRGRLV